MNAKLSPIDVEEIDLPGESRLLEISNPLSSPTYTPQKDVQALIWLTKRASGNLLEVGCNRGVTTRQVALHLPTRQIYGIDQITQRLEYQPNPELVANNDIGIETQDLPNSVCFASDLDNHNWKETPGVTGIFLDADHTYSGVKRDTAIALKHLESLPADQNRFLAWHDYATTYMMGHPSWLRVGQFVREQIAPNYKVRFVRETTLAWIEWRRPPKVAIAVITLNRLDLLKRCLPTWIKAGVPVWIWDNESRDETRTWLRRQSVELIESKTNVGNFIARNRMMEMARDRGFDYLLILDSDIELIPGAVERLIAKAEMSPDTAFTVFPQSVQMPLSEYGIVPEAASECFLVLIEAFRQIGGFPECLRYYSADSWWFTMATMLGWWTSCIDDRKGDGYIHHKHGSAGQPGASERIATDIAIWGLRERAIERYCRARVEVGKHDLFKGYA
jgi:hypothetical protein